jgi:sortase A
VITPRRAGTLAAVWVVVAIGVMALTVFELGPVLQQRDQQSLVTRFKVMATHAANEASSPIGGVTVPKRAPDIGSPVGIIEIGALRTQAVVVEGVQTAQTRRGPGHVPGTSGLGQQGNTVVVARRTGYGGAFARIGKLKEGDTIVVTTTQGQSLYRVATAGDMDVTGGGLDKVYGPTPDNRLTLVTSANRTPWQSSEATVVTAKLVTQPFAPTPQGALSSGDTGTHGDSGLLPTIVLVLLVLAAAVVGSVMLYRRLNFRTAYILTIAPLVALTLLAGNVLARLLPAWT